MIPLRSLILHNFWLKLFSLALATVIWLAIHNSIHSDVNLSQFYIRVPVTVQTAPGDNRIFRITPEEVVVVAVGKDTASFQATRKAIRVFLDLTHFNARQSVAEELVTVAPPSISVMETRPSTVEVRQISP
jgi:hypothetical protein